MIKILDHSPLEDWMWETFDDPSVNISVGAIRETINSYPIGSNVPDDEFFGRANTYQVSFNLRELVGKGFVELIWNDEIEDFTYKITEEGESALKNEGLI